MWFQVGPPTSDNVRLSLLKCWGMLSVGLPLAGGVRKCSI